MNYNEFVKTFTHVEMVHLDSDTSRDEPSLHHKRTWQMRLHQGTWQRGVTAGGCRNNPGNDGIIHVLTHFRRFLFSQKYRI